MFKYMFDILPLILIGDHDASNHTLRHPADVHSSYCVASLNETPSILLAASLFLVLAAIYNGDLPSVPWALRASRALIRLRGRRSP